jgi:hypothetical protein
MLQKYNNRFFLNDNILIYFLHSRSSERKPMKFAVQAMLGVSLVFAAPAFAATAAPAAQAAVSAPAHVKAVQDLLGAMQIQNVLRGVAARSRYSNDAQRQAVMVKIDKVPPAEVYQRLAPSLAKVISIDTATEMTRFYNTPYGKKILQQRYNSGPQLMMPGAVAAVPPEEKKERKRAAYVQASKELAVAEPAIEHEAFNLLQQINKEKR